MSKYDFGLDLDSENSLSIIIDMIKPNSKILEFGPAHGRLTKYLKEIMNCCVDIVELDEQAGIEASKYSNKYFIGSKLGNIENYLWLDELKEERYDYIVFADVLEHLYWPDKVLRKCKKVLKDEGSILLSLPNIAHNSVIIDLINDEFKYNSLGLLDNTHIRFFTYNSLLRMLRDVGLVSTSEKATYSKVGENEIINSYDCIDKGISKQLRIREKANIYQFIFEVKKREYCLSGSPIRSVNLDKASGYELVLYIKDKDLNIYTENKTIRQNIYSSVINQEISLKEYRRINEIRIDPITSNCIIEDLEIYTIKDNGRINLPIKHTNCDIKYDNKYFFSTEDPQIYIDLENINIDNIFLNYKLIDSDNNAINEIISLLSTINNEKDDIQKKLERTLAEKEDNVKMLEKKMLEEEDSVKMLENKMLEKEEYITILEKNLREKEVYIQNIENSRSWILVNKIKTILKR